MYGFLALGNRVGTNFVRAQAGRFRYAYYAYYAYFTTEEPYRVSISES